MLSLALLYLALSPASAAPALTPAPAVTVVTAATGTLTEQVVVTGTLVARDEVLVSPQIGDLAIVSLEAEEGDRMAAGQVLARLSHEALDASLAQNAAQIARADAAVAQAQSSIDEARASRIQADAALARAKDLVAGGITSHETFEARQQAAQVGAARLSLAQNALTAAQADAALARAQRQELDVRLDRTTIRAPVAGVVSRRTARLGSVVSMNGDPLFRLIQDGAVELEGNVPETRLARLAVGQPATITAGIASLPAHVRLVAPEINPTTRLGRVRIAPDADTAHSGQPGPIGSFSRATVDVARMSGVVLPLSAVLFDADGAHAQAVVDDTVQTRAVTVGLRSGGRVLLTAGVAAGDKVVAISGSFVRAGDRVRPMDGSSGDAPPKEGGP